MATVKANQAVTQGMLVETEPLTGPYVAYVILLDIAHSQADHFAVIPPLIPLQMSCQSFPEPCLSRFP